MCCPRLLIVRSEVTFFLCGDCLNKLEFLPFFSLSMCVCKTQTKFFYEHCFYLFKLNMFFSVKFFGHYIYTVEGLKVYKYSSPLSKFTQISFPLMRLLKLLDHLTYILNVVLGTLILPSQLCPRKPALHVQT